MSDRVVIKVGGSLLTEPGAIDRVATWLEATKQPEQTRVLIAGGGKPVEALREIDAANPLSGDASHWAAIRMMDASTRLLADWIPELSVAESIEMLLGNRPGDCVFPCGDWLRQSEPSLPGERLSVGWQTTSDSIAVRLASVLAARLIVVKHTIAAVYGNWNAAAEAGLVDAEFPRHAAAVAEIELLGLADL